MRENFRSDKPTGPVVLVTGTSSGVGLALAQRLARLPYRVVATARKKSLQHLKVSGLYEHENFLMRSLDVTCAEARRAVIEEIRERWGGVDILVNNAGIAYSAVVEEMTEDDELLQHATNYLGPMALTRLVLPHMRAQRWGRVINISSVSGMMAMPTMSSYSASKFALEGASESLWYEMKPWNVRVTLVQPGFIHSNSFQNVYRPLKLREDLVHDTPYRAYYRSMRPFIERLMNWSITTPDNIADIILRTMRRRWPPLRISATPDARVFYLLRRLLPRSVYHGLLYHSLPNVGSWVGTGKSDFKNDTL